MNTRVIMASLTRGYPSTTGTIRRIVPSLLYDAY